MRYTFPPLITSSIKLASRYRSVPEDEQVCQPLSTFSFPTARPLTLFHFRMTNGKPSWPLSSSSSTKSSRSSTTGWNPRKPVFGFSCWQPRWRTRQGWKNSHTSFTSRRSSSTKSPSLNPEPNCKRSPSSSERCRAPGCLDRRTTTR